ncbi:hypothetical protein Leryth_013682 [Lithospermum erythrorhizon]|nr:hypothetical protein Leryth_013682 [Lithospermum erythrorhizon]
MIIPFSPTSSFYTRYFVSPSVSKRIRENSCFGDDDDDGYWSSSDSLDEDEYNRCEFAWYDGVEWQDEQLGQAKVFLVV